MTHNVKKRCHKIRDKWVHSMKSWIKDLKPN
jgi:hypothetical protein